jgi:PII-like signaling protein
MGGPGRIHTARIVRLPGTLPLVVVIVDAVGESGL